MSSINLFFVRHGFSQHNEAPTHEIPDPYAISDVLRCLKIINHK
jgi:hypothetical protein